MSLVKMYQLLAPTCGGWIFPQLPENDAEPAGLVMPT
jgi:hypothetical protein